MAREHSAALVGEPQADQWNPDGRFGQYSLLMDPAVAWQPQTGPFTSGGDPSSGLLTAAARLGIPMAPFPFTAAGHVIHRGRGSLAAVYAAGDRSHPLYEWAAATMNRTSPEFPAQTSDTTHCSRNSVNGQARLPEQPWPQPAGAHQATSNLTWALLWPESDRLPEDAAHFAGLI